MMISRIGIKQTDDFKDSLPDSINVCTFRATRQHLITFAFLMRVQIVARNVIGPNLIE